MHMRNFFLVGPSLWKLELPDYVPHLPVSTLMST